MAIRYELPICGSLGTLEPLPSVTPVGQIDPALLLRSVPEHEIPIVQMIIRPISISHDPADPVAHIMKIDTTKLGVITYLGTSDHCLTDKLQDLDMISLECYHDIRMLES